MSNHGRLMQIAFRESKKSTCLRRSVGAVIVSRSGTVIGIGYNGPPAACISCQSAGCYRDINGIPSGSMAEHCRGLHAEQRALLSVNGELLRLCINATLYCTHHPCSICAKLIIETGIKEVVFRDIYPDELAKELFAEAGVKTTYLPPEGN